MRIATSHGPERGHWTRWIALLWITLFSALAGPFVPSAQADEAGDPPALDEALPEDVDGEDQDEDEDDDFALLNLEAMLDTVVSAAKHEQDITVSPSAITVIGRDQIENTHCTDLICLLSFVPEMDVLRIKPMYAAVGARALTDEAADKVLLLIDGQEFNNEVFGLVFWQALPIHLDDIERVEVIRGPGSALYGANAHSAVVSITTRTLKDRTAEASLGLGEQGRQTLDLRVGQAFDDWLLQATGGLEQADHWRVNKVEAREVIRARLRLDRKEGTDHTSFQVGATRAEGVIASIIGPAVLRDAWFADALIFHQAEHWRVQLADITQKAVIPFATAPGAERETIHYAGINLGTVPARVPFFNNNLDLQGQFNWSFYQADPSLLVDRLIVGGNYRWISAFSDELLPSSTHQHRIGLFLQEELEILEQLFLTAGVRLDYNTITPFTVSPRAAAIWRFLPGQSLRVAFGQAFRKPSIFNTSVHIKDVEALPGIGDSFVDFFQRAVGNEDLTNERVTNVEAGYRGRFFDERLLAEASFFYNRYRDTIAFHIDIPIGPLGPSFTDAVAEYQNAGREVDSLGGSLSLVFRHQRALVAGANYTYRHSAYSAQPSGLGADAEGQKGGRVSWEPAHLANVFAHYLFDFGLRLGVGWQGRSAHTGSYSTNGIFDRRLVVPVPAYHVFHGFVAYRLTEEPGYLEVGLKAFNAFNMPFWDQPGLADPAPRAVGGELIGRQLVFFARGAF